VEVTYQKGGLPQKVHFILTNMNASKENFHIEETALTTYWRRKDTKEKPRKKGLMALMPRGH